MRRLLTGGIKAIIAIAALSTAAHWAMRVQREPTPQAAALADPVATGSIPTRKVERPVGDQLMDVTRGLDQKRLSELFSGASPDKPKPQKAAAKH